MVQSTPVTTNERSRPAEKTNFPSATQKGNANGASRPESMRMTVKESPTMATSLARASPIFPLTRSLRTESARLSAQETTFQPLTMGVRRAGSCAEELVRW